MDTSHLRNIAIIAHVDHGKTTLVDQLFRQNGMFRANEIVAERLMDSIDVERERGITIASKNGAFRYHDYVINIIDTPGHADFGGQVERVLNMADGALLLVDAAEGPMPQTFFVLKKALALKIPVLVVINKIDKPAARPHWAVDEVFDLFVKLKAPNELLDFPVVYAIAREGIATRDPNVPATDLQVLCDEIVRYIPSPKGDPNGPPQMLVSSIDHSSFLGRLAIGKVSSGSFKVNQNVVVSRRDGSLVPVRIRKIYRFDTNRKVEADEAILGDLVALSGYEAVQIGETFTDPQTPIPLPPTKIDPPTIAMQFIPNDSPFAGREGTYVTSRHLRDRLFAETLQDVALQVEELSTERGYKVSGRGELHLSILMERMRREGYEFAVSRPQVITQEENGQTLEPYEELTVDVADEYLGKVIEMLGQRRGQLLEMDSRDGMTRLLFHVPTRGLLGFRSEFMSQTSGMGVMNYVFQGYGPWGGDIRNRKNGSLISMESGPSAGFALFNLQERGRLFIAPAVDIYEGQIIGEHSRGNDLTVNPCKGKKLTNMRASGSDENIILTPPTYLSLEDCIAYINDDELVEITPKSIRLRKVWLKEVERRRKGGPSPSGK